jgi:hypothetical protein
MHLWKIIYLAGAVLCICAGYDSLKPERTAETNADWIFVAITFVSGSLFPLGAMAYAGLRGIKIFRRPSLSRQPFGWWTDTLQPLRVSLASMAFICLGSCFALPKTDHKGVMLCWFYAALTAGLLTGEALVYRIFAKKIS